MKVMTTGHRPQKLGGYGYAAEQKRLQLARTIVELLEPEEATTGMALGWDTAWAIACIEAGIPLTAAVPHRGYEDIWPEASRQVFYGILDIAEDIVYVDEVDGYEVRGIASGVYHVAKLDKRNKWMGDNTDFCAAVWDGSKSGTGNCIAYLEKIGLGWENFWPQWKEMR